MNTLIVFAALAAAAYAAPGGIHGGAVISGPSGVVTNAGPIGPDGHGAGYGGYDGGYGGGYGGYGVGLGYGGGLGHGAVIAAPAVAVAPAVAYTAPSSYAVVSGPAHGAGIGLGLGGLGYGGYGGYGGYAVGGVAEYGVGHGAAAITPGGGTIGATAHGASIVGPPTAPVLVKGPSGKIVADGLWGPTANVGLGHGGGHGGYYH